MRTSLIALALALFIIVRANWLFLRPWPVWLYPDEGYISALALRMIEGNWLPYVDGVSHRGPMLYYSAALWLRVFGASVMAWRMLGLVASLSISLLVFTIGILAKRPFMAAASALFWVMLSIGWRVGAWHALGFNSEMLSNIFGLSALACIVRALEYESRARVTLLFASGLFCSLGAFSKQTSALALVALPLWVVAAARSRTEHDVHQRWRWVIAFAAGLLVPATVLVLRYASTGELSTFWYYLVEYNRDVYMGPLKGGPGWITRARILVPYLPIISALIAIGIGRLVTASSWRVSAGWIDANGLVVCLSLGSIGSAVASQLPLRQFGYYELLYFPWLGLLVAYLLERAVCGVTVQPEPFLRVDDAGRKLVA